LLHLLCPELGQLLLLPQQEPGKGASCCLACLLVVHMCQKCWSTYYPTYCPALPVAPVGMLLGNVLTLFDAGLQEKLAVACDVLLRVWCQPAETTCYS
jgi:hypothetical protein